jgi:hypothetical protein
MLPVSLDCLFLIAPSVLSKVYFFLSSITDKTFTGFYNISNILGCIKETGNIHPSLVPGLTPFCFFFGEENRQSRETGNIEHTRQIHVREYRKGNLK